MRGQFNLFWVVEERIVKHHFMFLNLDRLSLENLTFKKFDYPGTRFNE